ncbi:MAG: NAD(P)-dependent oxidoreductase [Rhodospirillales bacterium]|nr:NAD(P)-dependent oxidoreductase [Rhodospirillales bacterium]
MSNQTIAILMPGDMGHGVGLVLREHGYETITSLTGRSERSRSLAEAGRVRDAGDLDTTISEADLILSILPPAAALSLAEDVAAAMSRTGKTPVYVDCNAISPATAADVGARITKAGATFIDAGIIGLAPNKSKETRFYVSGPDVRPMTALNGMGFEVLSLGDEIGRASAMKMVYAAATKGSWTLWTAVLLTAARNGLLDDLVGEFDHSQQALLKNMRGKISSLPADSERWVGEMEEIAKTFSEAGVTSGFHDGAAWIFQLLSETPYAAETRQNMDTTRTMETSVSAFADALAKRLQE